MVLMVRVESAETGGRNNDIHIIEGLPIFRRAVLEAVQLHFASLMLTMCWHLSYTDPLKSAVLTSGS